MYEWYNRTNIQKCTRNVVASGYTTQARGGALMASISGIYQIRNTINGHCYIGSAVNIRNRWTEHKYDLRNNYHHSAYLQNAWNKYGAEYFVFSVIEYCDRPLLIEREQYYLDSFRPKYNISLYARTPMLGRVHSEEAKKKIGDSQRGKHVSSETLKRLSLSHIGQVITKIARQKISKALLGKKVSEETRRKLSAASKGKHNAIAVNQYTVGGVFIARYSGSYEAAKNTGIWQGNIAKCCNGKAKTAGGFIWRYENGSN